MARKSKKSPEELEAQRKALAKRNEERENFRAYAMDGRRYRSLTIEELLQVRAVIDAAIGRQKERAVKQLQAKKAEIEATIARIQKS